MKPLLLPAALLMAAMFALAADAPPATTAQPLDFIDTSFENASPLWYELGEDGTVKINLIYDQERLSPNRAAGHFHFRIQAEKGRKLTLEFNNLENVWNGKPGSVAKEVKQVVVSQDGKTWTSVPTESPEVGRVRVTLEMPGASLFVARAEPYRVSDLNRFLAEIQASPLVKVETIGKTVQGRDLEIIRVGKDDAPNHVFIRARAHPWEPVGNWVVEGLVRRLLKGDAEAQKCLALYNVCILPMANKDGVERGGTRFNLGGWDLNRKWDKPADPKLAPENAALERWLEGEIKAGRRPTFAMDLHNDGNGMLHISRPDIPDIDAYLARMKLFEKSLREHTWFTVGSTKPTFRNPGTLGEGWFSRFGIDAVILEFNCNYIEKLKQPALGKHWVTFGEGLSKTFEAYFAARK
ncbi:MAG: succinylglutamate desuccinylase/aspartoacylase family protein [Verrucomicrobiaceae bacterium]|nr:succinylglutamate desuccinylase/aspartoacylase family protein [Verrucomicrobiaceae bacterium]